MSFESVETDVERLHSLTFTLYCLSLVNRLLEFLEANWIWCLSYFDSTALFYNWRDGGSFFFWNRIFDKRIWVSRISRELFQCQFCSETFYAAKRHFIVGSFSWRVLHFSDFSSIWRAEQGLSLSSSSGRALNFILTFKNFHMSFHKLWRIRLLSDYDHSIHFKLRVFTFKAQNL